MLPLEVPGVLLAQLPTPGGKKKDADGRELPSTLPSDGTTPSVNPDLEDKFDQFFKTPDFTQQPGDDATRQKRDEYHKKVMGALDDELGGEQFYQPGQGGRGTSQPGGSSTTGQVKTAHLVTMASRTPKAVQLVTTTRAAVDAHRTAETAVIAQKSLNPITRTVVATQNAGRSAQATAAAIKAGDVTTKAAIGTKVATVSAKANVVLAPIAAGITGIDNYNYWTDYAYATDEVLGAQGYKESEFAAVKRERFACAAVHTTGMAAGATIGCALGIKAGLAGAGIGTLICPGIGTVAGAVIGGIFGFLSGLAIGGLCGDVVNSFIDRRGIARQFIESMFDNESKRLHEQLEEQKKAEAEATKKEKKSDDGTTKPSGEVKLAGLEAPTTISSAVYA